MKIRRFDRRSFVRNTIVNNVTVRARLDMRVVPIDPLPAVERPLNREPQLQAQTSPTSQDR